LASFLSASFGPSSFLLFSDFVPLFPFFCLRNDHEHLRTVSAATLACVFAVGCGSSSSDDSGDEDQPAQGALTNTTKSSSECTAMSSKVCTPEPGTETRTKVNSLLRAQLQKLMAIPSTSRNPAFEYDDFRVRVEEKKIPAYGFAYVRGRMMQAENNDVAFKPTGPYAGKSNNFEALVVLGGEEKVIRLTVDDDGTNDSQCWYNQAHQGEVPYAIPPISFPARTIATPSSDCFQSPARRVVRRRRAVAALRRIVPRRATRSRRTKSFRVVVRTREREPQTTRREDRGAGFGQREPRLDRSERDAE
jgi:hypothetical protein